MVPVVVTYKGDYDDPTDFVGAYQLPSEAEVERLRTALKPGSGFIVFTPDSFEVASVEVILEQAEAMEVL
ncbi:MAG: hypothetical protein A3G59_01215 [Candidatus Taylorbacteria bacterium RIFCSPLOWO2_12_FULL_47_20]|uniref:Uncharacterized protein n=2 Tax=Candidatus Tayloriibacteriota TaxID=1817919 RepID=A0A1G2P5S2_9BACT|nr:MAG: hypothetical protein A3H68_01800 [Candidatus Taylorbacteria bacterium RIFCSPLOWO2_02_FULL_46_40]OHA43678.1 MAG: hypothetical protein A3G59_01215 [Candidatus Taylorbacteria bacterium RIFCSPLOWO2_12_FULL_47_20]